jgi:hypothetical protein
MPRFVVQVRFRVNADNLHEARATVEQVIEHGEAFHGKVEWDWVNRARIEGPSD